MGWWPMFWKAWVRNVFWLHAPFIEKSVLDGQHLSSSSFLLQHSLTVFFWIHQDYHRGLSHGKSLLTSPRCFLATGRIDEGRVGWEMVVVDGGRLTVEHVLSWLWCNVWTIECYRSKQPMHDTLVVCGACELNCCCCMTECVQGYATWVELSGSGNGKLSAPSMNFLNDQKNCTVLFLWTTQWSRLQLHELQNQQVCDHLLPQEYKKMTASICFSLSSRHGWETRSANRNLSVSWMRVAEAGVGLFDLLSVSAFWRSSITVVWYSSSLFVFPVAIFSHLLAYHAQIMN